MRNKLIATCQLPIGVPKIVRTPILPILNDAVERHAKLAVLLNDAEREELNLNLLQPDKYGTQQGSRGK